VDRQELVARQNRVDEIGIKPGAINPCLKGNRRAGEWLDSDRPRQGLEHHYASLRAAGILLRTELDAGCPGVGWI